MNENEKKLLEELGTGLNIALVRLCSVQVCGPGVVAMAGAMEAVNGALERYTVLRDELKRLDANTEDAQ